MNQHFEIICQGHHVEMVFIFNFYVLHFDINQLISHYDDVIMFFYTYIFHKCCANLWCICGKAKIIHLGFFFRHYCLMYNAMLQRGITQYFVKNFPTRTFSIFRTNWKNNIRNGNPACCIILVQEIFGTRIEDFFLFLP